MNAHQSEKNKPSFLKRFTEMKVGDTLPNVELGKVNKAQKAYHLHDLITDHMVIVIATTSCSACEKTLTILDEHTRESSNLNIVLLMSGSNEEFQLIKTIFKDRLSVVLYPRSQILHDFRSSVVPYGYTVDQNGIILRSSIVSRMDSFRRLIQPVYLLREMR